MQMGKIIQSFEQRCEESMQHDNSCFESRNYGSFFSPLMSNHSVICFLGIIKVFSSEMNCICNLILNEHDNGKEDFVEMKLITHF